MSIESVVMWARLTALFMPMAVAHGGDMVGIGTFVDPIVVTLARFLEFVVVAVGKLVRLDISPSVVLTPAQAIVAMSITVSKATSMSMISIHRNGSESEDPNS